MNNRALMIIDRLHTAGHINNKEQGILRRAILLHERPQGEWDYKKVAFYGVCSNCGVAVTSDKAEMFLYEEMREFPHNINYCPNCGADMRKDEEHD